MIDAALPTVTVDRSEESAIEDSDSGNHEDHAKEDEYLNFSFDQKIHGHDTYELMEDNQDSLESNSNEDNITNLEDN